MFSTKTAQAEFRSDGSKTVRRLPFFLMSSPCSSVARGKPPSNFVAFLRRYLQDEHKAKKGKEISGEIFGRVDELGFGVDFGLLAFFLCFLCFPDPLFQLVLRPCPSLVSLVVQGFCSRSCTIAMLVLSARLCGVKVVQPRKLLPIQATCI